ncbi:MAG: RecQ family zinc-binding domain-containing protein, partial [Chitinophagaceae bacterium]|nr:RecQ family zinc-binding domain-containing protein [Chitinophagaceae bacterium]
NMLAFNQRKERYLQRVKEIVRYVKETTECRSRIIGVYFGDEYIKTCGICDNCLRQKAISLTKEEFDQLHHLVINLVKYESLPVKELLLKLNGVKKEKAWKVIEFLQAEHKIEMDTNGYIHLK